MSTLFDLLDKAFFVKWHEEIRAKDESNLEKNANELKQLLSDDMTDKQKKLLCRYALSIEDKVDYIHFVMEHKILNLGIKIGMELQKEFFGGNE